MFLFFKFSTHFNLSIIIFLYKYPIAVEEFILKLLLLQNYKTLNKNILYSLVEKNGKYPPTNEMTAIN